MATAAVGEVWRPVPACRWFGITGGQLAASSEGRVRSAAGRVLAPVPDKDGYLRVKWYGRWLAVHVLVCLAFHGGPQVRHLGDGVTDNRPAKLAWGSRLDNERDKKDYRGSGYPPVPAVTPVTDGQQER